MADPNYDEYDEEIDYDDEYAEEEEHSGEYTDEDKIYDDGINDLYQAGNPIVNYGGKIDLIIPEKEELDEFNELASKILSEKNENNHLQDIALQLHFKSAAGTKKLPRRNIDDESDVLDFLLLDQTQQDELLKNLESLILSIQESASVYLRIGKLFNFISQKLNFLIDNKSLLDEDQSINELNPFLDLFQRCLEAVRLSSFANICVMPEYLLLLGMDKPLFEKLLSVATTILDQLPQQTEKLLTNLIVFVINPPAPFVTGVDQAVYSALEYFVQNLFNRLSQSFFKLLSVILLASPPDIIPGYIDLVILPLKEIMMESIQSKKGGMSSKEEEKMDIISVYDLDDEDERNYEIMKFLLVAINNQKVARSLIEAGFHDILYGVLRNTCDALTKQPITIPPSLSKLATSVLSSLLGELEPTQLGTFREIIYSDICTGIEEQKISFVLEIITPVLAGAKYRAVPLCLHLEEDLENTLDQYRSAKNGTQMTEKAKIENKAFKSEGLSHQERSSLLQQIQHLSLDSKSKRLRIPLKLDQCEWKRVLKVDYSNEAPTNLQPICQSLVQNDGVLFIFSCLYNDEICKIGVYCSDKMAYNYSAYGQLGGIASYGLLTTNSEENFIFYYSQTQRLHYLTKQPPVQANNKKLTKKSSYGNVPISLTANYCLSFSHNKMILYQNGAPLVEYSVNNLDEGRVVGSFKNMTSEEEKRGQKVFVPNPTAQSFSCVQGVECWTIRFPQGQKQLTEEELFLDQYSTPTKLYLEYLGCLRRSPIILVPQHLTIGQILSLLSKSQSSEIVKQINCKIVPQEDIETNHQLEKVLEMFQGSEQNILDLFLTSKQGVKWLNAKFTGLSDKFYERILSLAKTDSKLTRELLAPERLEEIFQRIKRLAAKKNKLFSDDIGNFYDQLKTLMKIGSCEELLAQNEMFFYTLLKVVGAMLKDDVENYKKECLSLKLESLLFKAFIDALMTKNSKDQLANLDAIELLTLILNKITSINQSIDSGGMIEHKPEEPPNKIKAQLPLHGGLFGVLFNPLQNLNPAAIAYEDEQRSQALKTELNKKLFQNLLSCVGFLFEKELPAQTKKEVAAKMKEFKVNITISKFVSELDEGQTKFHQELKNLLRRWSEDILLSEVFWENVPDIDAKNTESKYTLYQMLLSLKEQAEHALQQDKAEETKNDLNHKKMLESRMGAQLGVIALVNEIEKNLRRYYDIEIVEKTTDLSQFLNLPLNQAYPKILKELCVDSASMKKSNGGGYEHHYNASIKANMNQQKTHRILKEIGDLATSLPISETNAIFVRYDRQRMDVMKALIFGSRDTPYAHGAFLYDLFIPDNYPNGPPHVNLETTGNGTVRFNPNLYNCGKVCLSLLGTWTGHGNENWNPKHSTLLQVLISIQSIIMIEGIYYNEPGHARVTEKSALLNKGYGNVVKYANIRYAMIETLKKPAPWFKDVIQIHFYLKKDMILADCEKWIAEAKYEKVPYEGAQNPTFSAMFSKSQLAYHDKLVEVVKELKSMFAKLNITIEKSIRSRTVNANKKAIMEIEEAEEIDIDTRVEKIETIDVSYENKVQQRAIDINDEKVTNRWSRYIGAMGIEAVEKQANAQICLFGLNAVGVEIAKNIILSGVKRFTICDGKKVTMEDIAGQFYLTEDDVGKNRAKACLHKLQALNQYVIIDFIEISLETCYAELSKFLAGFNVMIACEGSNLAQTALNDYCRKAGGYFVSATVHGHFSRIFCDFGENFRVSDKTGEEYQDMIIKAISNDKLGLVTLIDGTKHNLQDGDEVMISQVVESQADQSKKSINGTLHKVTVVDKSSFYIGDTSVFRNYLHNGVVKQLKLGVTLNFKPLSQLASKFKTLPPFDPTISSSDWNFIPRVIPLHIAFQKIDWFVETHGRLPNAWSDDDATLFMDEVMNEIWVQFPDQWNEIQATDSNKTLMRRILQTFSFTCSGVFPPLAAFIGGVAAQEAIKAITKKYMPINQYFYYETSEIISSLDVNQIKTEAKKLHKDRDLALKICIGDSLLSKLAASRMFMVGAGAIGCELLKNFAMVSLGTGKEKGKEGRIYLTDPDVIENSNLNRQFLFREKHIRKPKSTTAAAVAVSMNNKLRGNIKPLVEKVHDQTESLFSNTFFESLDVVANALDNVNARKYVDSRCVKARKPLLESGTLGPKGHVQVIMPFKTESYGSQQDPQEDNGEIPYCTLKMFPEETLHCVEWARDKFNKMFTQKPRSFEKVLEDAKSYDDLVLQDHKILAEAYRFLKNWPQNFGDCVAWARNKFEKFFVNDIKQLLHTYPLDHKLENGSLFWTLPKRPPTTIIFDPNNEVHASFVAACACLRAMTCGIPIDRKDPRNPKSKLEIAQQAAKVKPKVFVQSDKKAQSLKDQADKGKDGNQNENKEIDIELSKEDIAKNILSLFKQRVGDLAKAKNKMKCSPQEFEKDEDENFHIDVLFAMTNCRAINYKLAPMDWITVKLKAGRIIPALATTTSAIAALQTIELVKLIANIGAEDHKNSFLNLSIPILTQSEPSAAPVYKLNSKLTANLWDRWEIDLAIYEDVTSLETLFDYLKAFTSLEPLDCLRGNTAVYIASLMSMPNKKKEQMTLLKQPLKDTLGIRNQKYVDLTITFTSADARLKNPKDFTIKGVPTIRLIFPKENQIRF